MFKVIDTFLAAPLTGSGTFTVGYPTGMERGDFLQGRGHILLVGQNKLSAPKDFDLTFNAANITVTLAASITSVYPAMTRVRLQAEQRGQNDKEPEKAIITDKSPRMVRSVGLSVSLGSPLTLAAAALRAAAASAAANVNILAAAYIMDEPRNVTILSAGNDSGVTFTVTGVDDYGQAMIENITGANAGTANGLKAFKQVTSITQSGAAAGNVSVGYGNVLGLPVFLPATPNIITETVDGATATAGTKVAGSTVKATATTGDVRGTYVPNSAPDGTKGYILTIMCTDPNDIGGPQFAG